jgi:hypothetical protein
MSGTCILWGSNSYMNVAVIYVLSVKVVTVLDVRGMSVFILITQLTQ